MSVEDLKKRIRGSVITAEDASYGAVADALIWNGRKPERLARLIVRVANAADVQEAVRYAAAQGLRVVARGGGHHFSGLAAGADMVIDLGGMTAIRVEPRARIARVEPGATNGQLVEELARFDLAFPTGHCASVPMSGYLLGGGIGWNAAEWGIACFSIRRVELVMADGRAISASATEHPEIFWAVRGAGPEFFGIVTAYHLDLQPLPKAITTVIRVYPGQRVVDVAAWAERVMAVAPACVEFSCKVMPTPQGPVIGVAATVFATNEALAHLLLEDLGRGAPEGALEVIGPMPTPFEALYQSTGAITPEGRRYITDTFWSRAGLAAVLGRLVKEMELAPSMQSFGIVELRSNAQPAPEGAAFSCDGRIFAVLFAVWDKPSEDAANIGWLRISSEALAPHCHAAYIGQADLERRGTILPTLSAQASVRLLKLAAQYDPAGRFVTPSRRRAAIPA